MISNLKIGHSEEMYKCNQLSTYVILCHVIYVYTNKFEERNDSLEDILFLVEVKWTPLALFRWHHFNKIHNRNNYAYVWEGRGKGKGSLEGLLKTWRHTFYRCRWCDVIYITTNSIIPMCLYVCVHMHACMSCMHACGSSLGNAFPLLYFFFFFF